MPTKGQCFIDNGWTLYTFGFGQSNDALLTTIAEATGGTFARLPTGDLVCAFQAVRAQIAGSTPATCTTYQITPNQTLTFPVTIPANQGQATFSTSWPGSDVVLTLVSPSGRVIDRATVAADVTHEVGPTFEVYTLTRPEAGTWTIELFGADVPPAGEPVTFGYITLPDTDPTPVITGVSPVAPVCVLRTSVSSADRTIVLRGTDFPAPRTSQNIQFRRSDTGAESLHMGIEVEWRSATEITLDIATVAPYLWPESPRVPLQVRLTDFDPATNGQIPLTPWGNVQIVIADNATACAP
ncbi:hypothetical protein HC891_18355 [Candidatus Gracilibacteria bacterium]|nr:hypothetical protein [Candidatus Gracilibacteria bacterium]